ANAAGAHADSVHFDFNIGPANCRAGKWTSTTKSHSSILGYGAQSGRARIPAGRYGGAKHHSSARRSALPAVWLKTMAPYSSLAFTHSRLSSARVEMACSGI